MAKRKSKKKECARKKQKTPAREEEQVQELSSERESSSGSENEEMTASSKESGPNQPLEFFFDSSQFTKLCKIQTRCNVYETVKLFKTDGYERELRWFTSHPQFCHIFHMPQEKSRKLMGMWMLLLRTIVTNEKTMKWFVVNGTSIRYSLREHALISGLYCNEYPTNMDKLGSNRFREKHFKKVKYITCAKVKAKLLKMSESTERLKMAVLYFLCTVIRGVSKVNGPIDPLILRLVDDLEVCREFPWGRVIFEDAVKEINHVNNLMKGTANKSYTFPGFIIPLEFLAFECIPKLTHAFREPATHGEGCPRMCHWKFTGKGMRGYPLEDIYHAVGDTKDIQSILVPKLEEEPMMARIISEEPDDDDGEGVSSRWNDYLSIQQKKIWWEELYQLDLANRDFPKKKEEEVEEESVPNVEALKEMEERITLMVQSQNQELKRRLERMEKRVLKMKKTQRIMKKKIRKMVLKQLREKAPLNSYDAYEDRMEGDWGGTSYDRREVDEEDKEEEEENEEDVEEKEEEEVEDKEEKEENEEEVEEKEGEEVEDKEDEEENEEEVEEKEGEEVEDKEEEEENEGEVEEKEGEEEEEENEEEVEEKEGEGEGEVEEKEKEEEKEEENPEEEKEEENPEEEKAEEKEEEKEEEKVYDPKCWALVPFVEVIPLNSCAYEEVMESVIILGDTESIQEEEGEKADPPKKKRGRPRKTETNTPKPKRKCTPSQWVQSPFTQGKTPEIAEGAKKKRKKNMV